MLSQGLQLDEVSSLSQQNVSAVSRFAQNNFLALVQAMHEFEVDLRGSELFLGYGSSYVDVSISILTM